MGLKLPTGAGKSLIALLILEAWRRQNKSVAILASNKALALDLKKRCEGLSIPCATIFGAESGDDKEKFERTKSLARYRSKKLIGIFNYASYLFGTYYRQDVSIADVLVIDDASEFEATRADFFTLKIDRAKNKELYKRIINSLWDYRSIYPSLESFLDYSASHDEVELIRFVHDEKVISAIKQHIQQFDYPNKDFKFAYERIKEMLDSLLIFINQEGIEFRPLIVPEENLRMGGSTQMILMSATLPTEDLLYKTYGIRKQDIPVIDETKLTSEARAEIETMGKRLILPLDNTELSYRVGSKCLGVIETLYSKHKKILVLANSFADAREIENYLHGRIPVYHFGEPEDGYKFAYDVSDGVLVCANRHTGLDFPADTCKVCIIVRLPFVMDHIDAFYSSVLKDVPYIEQKIAYRLIQSFGRCNRLEKDEAIYYILDSRIIPRLIGEEQYLKYFPRNIRAEIQTGYYLSDLGNITKSIEYGASNFFDMTDPKFENTLKEEKDMATEPSIVTSLNSVSRQHREIEAWEKMFVNAYEAAAQMFDLLGDEVASAENSNKLIAAFYYYLSSMAYYQGFVHYRSNKDKEYSLEELEKSIQAGGQSSWFNHLRSTYNELVGDSTKKKEIDVEKIAARRIKEQIVTEFENFINRNSSKARDWKSMFGEKRKWISNGTHGQMLSSLLAILELLGYKARRGDNTKGEPDIIASSSTTTLKYLLSIECKTREEGEEESASSITQTMGDAGVMQRQHPDYKIYPVLITQKEELSTKAVEVAKRQVTVIRTEDFDTLLERLFKSIEKASEQDSWERKQAFIDSVVSPFELESIFTPSDSLPVSPSAIREI